MTLYRRFIQMYSDVVLGVDHALFEEILDATKEDKGLELDTELSADDLKRIAQAFKDQVEKELGRPFPDDVHEQLWGAIGAVFGSWHSSRANTYRKLHNIPEDWGTAVTVQAMVFGNRGETSATGVAFTRDPSTGEKILYGEFLINAQGEDVVAGIRTTQPISKLVRERQGGKKPSMEEAMPAAYAELKAIGDKLEAHYRDMQDVEFTVQEGKLFMLQTRSGKRTAEAALKAAVGHGRRGPDRQKRPLWHMSIRRHWISCCIPHSIPTRRSSKSPSGLRPRRGRPRAGSRSRQTKQRSWRPKATRKCHSGAHRNQSRGYSRDACGARHFDGTRRHDEPRGGRGAGHGAALCRGAGMLKIDVASGTMSVGATTLKRGDVITIDGASGQVFMGSVPMRQPELTGDFGMLMGWADSIRTLKVRTNADTPTDAATARGFGAEGIGLCRTEHMFFDGPRIVAVRQMILADQKKDREAALAKLPADAAWGFRGDLQGDGRLAGHDPPARSAAARILAAQRRGNRRSRARGWRGSCEIAREGNCAARIQSDVGPPWVPIGHYLSRDL